MRIPMFRRGGDNTPIQWWEWLFMPVMAPVFVIILITLAAASIPMSMLQGRRTRENEEGLRSRLAAEGRYCEWAEVSEHLKRGEGTLIVEHMSLKGPIREWWIEDEIVAAAPVPLPPSFKLLPSGSTMESLLTYARQCASKYIDVNAGQGKLTVVPESLAPMANRGMMVIVEIGGAMTAIPFTKGRDLAVHFPRGNIVTLVEWNDEPILMLGDAEAVFLRKS